MLSLSDFASLALFEAEIELLVLNEFASLKLSEAETLVDSLFDFASLALLLALVLVDSLVDFASLALSLALVLVDSLLLLSDSDFFVISTKSLWNFFKLSDNVSLLDAESDALSETLSDADFEL